jgi:hypothetical protein
MFWTGIHKTHRLEHLILLLILILAFFVAFIPHFDYPYPLHVDEWLHGAYSKAIMQSGSITFTEPFSGQSFLSFTSNPEAGFHLFLSIFQQMTGVSSTDVFRYLPGVVFLLTILSVYTLGKKLGFGWQAAFFVSIIPTTVGILGPALLVPVSVALVFVPLVLLLAFEFRTPASYLLILLSNLFLLSAHAPSALCVIILLIPYIVINLRSDFKHSMGITAALLLPFLIALPLISDLVLSTARDLFTTHTVTEHVQVSPVIRSYGYLPFISCLFGVFILVLKGSKQSYGLVFGLLALLVMLVTFYTFHYGIPILHERGLLLAILTAGIIAGAGLMKLSTLKLPIMLKTGMRSFLVKHIGLLLTLVVVSATLATVIPNRLNTPYYHMIDDKDYHSFVWVSENLKENYDRAILDPWKATAFTAITGKKVYTRIHFITGEKDLEAYDFINGGASDSSFLRNNGLSIVYTRVSGSAEDFAIEYTGRNPDLVEVSENIYVLDTTGKGNGQTQE